MPSMKLSRPFDAYKGNDPYILVLYAYEDARLIYPEPEPFFIPFSKERLLQ